MIWSASLVDVKDDTNNGGDTIERKNGEDADAFDGPIDRVVYEWMQDFLLKRGGYMSDMLCH